MATAYFVQMWEWASQKLPFRWRGAGLATFLFRGSKKKGGGGGSVLFLVKASSMFLPCPMVW